MKFYIIPHKYSEIVSIFNKGIELSDSIDIEYLKNELCDVIKTKIDVPIDFIFGSFKEIVLKNGFYKTSLIHRSPRKRFGEKEHGELGFIYRTDEDTQFNVCIKLSPNNLKKIIEEFKIEPSSLEPTKSIFSIDFE